MLHQLNVHFRKPPPINGEPMRKENAAANQRQAQPERALAQAAHFLQLRLQVVSQRQHGLGFLEHLFPRRRQPALAARALKKLNVQLLFQLLHGLADGGLRHMQAVRRPGETVLADHGHKGFQSAQFHILFWN